MYETLSFPVAWCEACARDVVVARDLDDDDRWVELCTRCDAQLPAESARKAYGVTSVTALGYTIEGTDSGGCGSGGCGSCGAKSA